MVVGARVADPCVQYANQESSGKYAGIVRGELASLAAVRSPAEIFGACELFCLEPHRHTSYLRVGGRALGIPSAGRFSPNERKLGRKCHSRAPWMLGLLSIAASGLNIRQPAPALSRRMCIKGALSAAALPLLGAPVVAEAAEEDIEVRRLQSCQHPPPVAPHARPMSVLLSQPG